MHLLRSAAAVVLGFTLLTGACAAPPGRTGPTTGATTEVTAPPSPGTAVPRSAPDAATPVPEAPDKTEQGRGMGRGMMGMGMGWGWLGGATMVGMMALVLLL
jgi:hypothetical protein